MSLVLMSRETARLYPPEPWLVSTLGDIERDEQEKDAVVEKWLQKHPYPATATGAASSLQEVMDWMSNLQARYEAYIDENLFLRTYLDEH